MPCCSGVGLGRAQVSGGLGVFLRGFSHSRAAGHCKKVVKWKDMSTWVWVLDITGQRVSSLMVPFDFRVTLQVLAGFSRGVWVP